MSPVELEATITHVNSNPNKRKDMHQSHDCKNRSTLVDNIGGAAIIALLNELRSRLKYKVFPRQMAVKEIDYTSFFKRCLLKIHIDSRVKARLIHIIRKHQICRKDCQPIA